MHYEKPCDGDCLGSLFSRGRTLSPIKCGGIFLDNLIAHVICKRPKGFHEANLILSQKAKGPGSAKVLR